MSDSPAAVQNSVHDDLHSPALLHHFATEEQQRNASNFGMWIFLGTEVMFFGGLFCAYLIYRRLYFPDFAAASTSIDAFLGGTNTAVLICSSLTVVLAIWAAQTARRVPTSGRRQESACDSLSLRRDVRTSPPAPM